MQLPQYPRYESYKSVKLELSQTIPKHWDVWKMAHAFEKIGSGTTPDTGRAAYYDGEISWLQTGDLTDGDVFSTNKTISPLALREYSTLKVYPTGSLVMAMYGATIGKLGKLRLSAATNQACCVFAESNVVTTQFAFYSLLAMRPFILSDAYGGGQPNISQQTIKEFRLVVPPLQEQQAIARFLDDKTDKIDRAVKIKEGQIALLRERRQILIQQAVTRGLNPDAPMKDSGIDWIGQIPAHWEVRRNFALFRETKNAGNAGLPVLSVSIHSGVSKEELSEEENIRSIIKIEDRSSYKEVLPGDIAYNMMRAWQGGIGAVHTHGMVSPAYVVARPIGDLVADYFELLYRTPAFIRQMDASSKGITDFRKRLYWDDFRDCLTIVPPKAEQEEIIRQSSDISAKIQNAISLKESQITALREYKTSLINAAVTGKIKVI